ncbi:FixH family protein [Alkalihalophilus marmarensis]|uniref:FixH family protein n=1 Tax=Alkalihalophilus marmarensis TaxID=521377 RepID=UPI002E1E7930|nr:FixH family protein [Alkalihalophilus marmarensis]
MKLEKVLRPEWVIPAIIVLFILGSGAVLFLAAVSKDQVVTNWSMNVAGLDEFYQTGEAVDIHLFLEDAEGHPIEDANVSVLLDRPETVHHMNKVMHKVEGGLYVTEAIFSLPGTWIGMVEAVRGKDVYRNQFLLRVEGGIIAESNRDPEDAFTLDQPLPAYLQKEMEAIPASHP